jgi:hypothetical protein
VSDQDFFFDEDEQSAQKPAAKAAPAKGTAPKATASAPAASAQSVTITVAALIGVVALLAGVIVGILLPVNIGSSVPAPSTGIGTTTGGQAAPQLSPEQLQGGQLPAGHPQIGGTGGNGSTTTTK